MLAAIAMLIGVSQASASQLTFGSGAYADCSFGCTYVLQQVYAASLFPGPIDITGVSFLADPLPSDTGWSGNSTWQMSLSTSPNGPGSLSSTFAANVGADNAVFGNLTPSGNPSAGTPVTFSGSFDYNPAKGPLLVDLQLTSGPLVGDAHLAAGYNPGLTDRAGSAPGGPFANQGGYALETQFTFTPVTPLPAALPLFATGLGGLGLLGWRRKRKAQAAAA